ncbi:MAG: tetratricopeptide repeat protein [Acidobacteria bacterium]|nr:tetratricopeptide repeat protein [Acidobacteriota bacterium]
MERPIYLSGEVRLANGEIPPEPVRIERICNGQNRPEGYTDLKGRFNFQVGGNNSAALTDASYSGFGQSGNGMNGAGNFGGMGGAGTSFDGSLDLSGCELRASLAGFRSDQIMLTRRRSMDNPDVGVIVLHPLAGFQGEIVSATTLTAPKKAKANYDKGVRELRKSEPKFDKAAQYLEAAVAEHPKFASAWTWLAEARLRLDDQEGAEEALTKAIEADPAYIRPYEPLVQIALRKEDWPRVAELADATLRMYPGHTQIRYYKAVAAYRLGQIEVAEATAREIAAGSDAKAFPHAYQMMGVIYAQKGSFPQAADSFRTYLEMSPQAPSAEQIRKQLNEWEALGVIKPAETAEAK